MASVFVTLVAWLLIAVGIVRGLLLVARGCIAQWHGGIRAMIGSRTTGQGLQWLAAAGSCGGFVFTAAGFPL